MKKGNGTNTIPFVTFIILFPEGLNYWFSLKLTGNVK